MSQWIWTLPRTISTWCLHVGERENISSPLNLMVIKGWSRFFSSACARTFNDGVGCAAFFVGIWWSHRAMSRKATSVAWLHASTDRDAGREPSWRGPNPGLTALQGLCLHNDVAERAGGLSRSHYDDACDFERVYRRKIIARASNTFFC